MNVYRHATILAVIIVAACVFALDQSRGAGFAASFGAVPAAISGAARQLASGDWSRAAVGELSRLVTALLLHGDAEHIVFNLVFLWTFGYLASQILGQWWALAIFVLTGVCGNILQVCLNQNSPAPIIGASGAVCGFQGVYLALAIRWTLPWPDIWPLAHPIPPMQLGAFAVLGFIADVVLITNRDHHIAYGAHVGGFISGFAIATLITAVYPTPTRFERAWHVR
jgi:membrane associated rhomboid family serine protease